MSTVADRASGPPAASPRPSDPTPYPVVAGLLAALRAATAGLVGMLVPVVLAWMVSAGGDATWPQAVQLGLTLWLLAQHTPLAIDGGQVAIVPLGAGLLPLAACWYAGRRMARVLDPAAERIAAGSTLARPCLPPRTAMVTFVAGYAALAVLAAFAAAMPVARPLPFAAGLAGLAVSALGGGAGVAAYRFGGLRAGLAGVLLALPLPGPSRRWLRPGAWALAVHLLVSVVVLAAAVAAGRDQVLALHRALDPGLLGGLVLALGQVALAPNLVLWTAAVLAGPGFAVGSGTSVTLTWTTLGPLPAVPILGALPPPGPMPGPAILLLLVPVAAGCLAGALVLRSAPVQKLWSVLADVAGSAGVAGLGFAVLAWLGGGSAGPGRLAVTGPQPLLAGVAMAAEVLVGALLTVLVGQSLPVLFGSRQRVDHPPTPT